MEKKLKGKIKKGMKIGAAIGFGFGVTLSLAAKPDDMGNLEFMLRASGATAGCTAICSMGGAAMSAFLYYKEKVFDYIDRRFSENYKN